MLEISPSVRSRMAGAPRSALLVRSALAAVAFSLLALPMTSRAQSTAEPPAGGTSDTSVAGPGDEIIVTATRREERLIDVPASITALSGAGIENRGLIRFQDFLVSVPGVAFQDRGPGRNKIVIRGVSSGTAPSEVPMVATFLGEVPISVFATTQAGTPDIKLFDIERVEVLRGPQGTLFGAGSMGGALRIIPTAPKLGVLSADAMATVQSVRYGDVGFDVGAAVNIPAGENAAFRFVGYRYETPGYIDNIARGDADVDFSRTVPILGGSWNSLGITSLGLPQTAEKDLNTEVVEGGRISAFLQASDRLDVTASAMYQSTRVGGQNDIYPNLGAYEQRRSYPERLADKISVFNLLVNYDAEDFNLLSSTGYYHRQTTQARDLFGQVSIPLYLLDKMKGDFFVQELRISSKAGSPFDWLAGVYYSYQDKKWNNSADWYGSDAFAQTTVRDLFGLPPGSVWQDTDYPLTERQFAVFGEVGYDITDRLKLTAGGRWFQYVQKIKEVSDEFSFFGGPAFSEAARLKEDSFSPRAILSYKVGGNALLHAQVAKGFRVGTAGVLGEVPPTCAADLAGLGITNLPAGSSSDSVWSYEVGSKGSFGDGRVTAGAALFYIDWNNIQTSFTLGCGLSFRANAGKARSRGVEAEFSFALSDNVSLDLTGSYVDAVLKEDTPAVTGLGGRQGDRLPGIPKINARAGLNLQWPISGEKRLTGNLDATYVGGYYSSFRAFQAGTGRGGDYLLVNLRAGVDAGKWRFELYANNLFDKDVILLFDPQINDGRLTTGRPRTLGATVRTSF